MFRTTRYIIHWWFVFRRCRNANNPVNGHRPNSYLSSAYLEDPVNGNERRPRFILFLCPCQLTWHSDRLFLVIRCLLTRWTSTQKLGSCNYLSKCRRKTWIDHNRRLIADVKGSPYQRNADSSLTWHTQHAKLNDKFENGVVLWAQAARIRAECQKFDGDIFFPCTRSECVCVR